MKFCSDHLVESIVTADVLANDLELAIRIEKGRGVKAAGLFEYILRSHAKYRADDE